MATAVDAASAAASTPAAQAAPAAAPAGVDYAQSDEQILGIDAPQTDLTAAGDDTARDTGGSAAETQTPAAEAKPGEAKTDATAADEVTIATAAGPAKLDLRRVPQAWRELARQDPEFAAAMLDRLELAELGVKLDDVRALRAELPEGLNSLKALREEIAESQRFDGEYASGDPDRQAQVAETMFRENQDAFLGMFRASSQMLSKQAPEQYNAIAGEILTSTLRADGFDGFLNSIRDGLASATPEEMKAALQSLLDWGTHRGVGLSAEEQLKHMQTQERQRVEAETARAYQDEVKSLATFHEEIDAEVAKQENAAIGELLDKALPQAFPQKMREKIVAEVRADIDAKLQANAQFQEQYKGLYRLHVLPSNWNPQSHPKGRAIGMRLSADTRKPFVDFKVGQIKALAAGSLQAILPEWTSHFVSANNERVNKAVAAASRTDVGTASGAGTRPRGEMKRGKVDYAQMTDEQILEL